MEGFEFVLLMMYLSIGAIYLIEVWCFVVSYRRYKFSLWWIVAVVILFLAPVFIFPLCGNLRYSAAKRQNKPTEELAQNLLYRRLGWMAVLYFIVIGAIVRGTLTLALPEYNDINELAFVLTMASLAVASLVCLLGVKRKSCA